MISLCTVSCSPWLDQYVDILTDSIVKKTELISEVLIAAISFRTNENKEWTKRGINFKRFNFSPIGEGPLNPLYPNMPSVSPNEYWNTIPDAIKYIILLAVENGELNPDEEIGNSKVKKAQQIISLSGQDNAKNILRDLFPKASADYEELKNKNTLPKLTHYRKVQQGIEHALGLHECINRASNDFVLLCEPDIFFYSAAEKLYLSLFEKYNLNIVGLSHHNSVNMGYSFFPWIGNCVFKKSTMPDDDFLKDYLKFIENDRVYSMPGKFIIPYADTLDCRDPRTGKMNDTPDLAHKFPNPKGCFDTGSNLVLWNESCKGNWLAFQTADCHTYTTAYHRGNLKIKEKLKKIKLAYHSVGASLGRQENLEEFKMSYKESLEDD